MKNEPLPNNLREQAWRRKLTNAERSQLQSQPEAQAELELESHLSDVLARLPDTSVPSNFTARVLQAIEREEARAAQPRSWSWYRRVLIPRMAVAAVIIGFAGLAYQQYESDKRATLARNIALLAQAQPMPSVEALKNFDAIRRMSQATPGPDNELLSLLQ